MQQEYSSKVQKLDPAPTIALGSQWPHEATVEETLKACKNKLTENALSKEYWMTPSAEDTGKKYDYIAETRNFVLSSIESRGRSGSLYLCGRPGTGKVGIQHIFVQLTYL
jgi:hypothetical protein